MTEPEQKSWSKRLRTFAAFPLPLLLFLIAWLATPKDMREPTFMNGWRVEAKAIALFAAVALLSLVLDLWSKWIDPIGHGARRMPLSSFFDSASGTAAMAGVVAIIAYGKDLTHLSPWWIGLGILAAGAFPMVMLMVRTFRNNGTRS